MHLKILIASAITKFIQLPFLGKSILLVSLLLAAFKGSRIVNQMLQESLERSEKLSQFETIQDKLEGCWTPLRQLTLFLGCLTQDDSVMAEITFLLSSCFLQQHDLPPIECHSSISSLFCIKPTCPHTCATIHSARFSKQFGFNIFQVIYEGIQKFCYSTSKREDTEIWEMKIPWDQITTLLTQTDENALTLKNSDSQRIYNLKYIFHDLLQREKMSSPFKIKKSKHNEGQSQSSTQLNL